MKLDVVALRTSMEQAKVDAGLAEEAGFDGYWVTEVANDPYLSIAAAIDHTRSIELGTAIALAFPRSPMSTALAAWELQRACGGRFSLGLGPQVRAHIERRFSAPFDSPGPRLREYVLALRAIFAAFEGTQNLEFAGQYYRLDLLPPFFRPDPLGHPPPPIFVAAVGPYTFGMAGEVADGVHVHPLHTSRFLREVARPRWSAGLAAAGRAAEEFTVSAQVFAIAGHGEERARLERSVRTQLAFHATTPAYRGVLELHGLGEVAQAARKAMASGDPEEIAAVIPEEMLREFAIVCEDWFEVGAAVRHRYADLVDRVSLYTTPPLGDVRTQALVAAFRATA